MISKLLRSAFACLVILPLAGTVVAQNQALSVSNNPQGGYIDIPASPALAPPSFTIEAWFTYDDSVVPAGWVYPTIGRKNFTQGVAEWFLRVDAGNIGSRILRVWIGGSGGVTSISSPFTAGQFLSWTHIAVTYDGSVALLYLNGNQVAQATGTGPILDLGSVARIGAGDTAPGSANELWNGLLDDVRIWSVARTQAEIATGMTQHILSAPGLNACYRLDGNGLDATGNGNHGAGVNAPTYVTIPSPGGPPTYCTAKLNSQGCAPSIAASGVMSATASSGFVLSASQELNNKVGLVLYSEFGRDAAPFGAGGLLCVKAPTRRSKGFNAGGNPPPAQDCSGVFAIDFNTFARGLLGAPPNPAAYLSLEGQIVTAQFWGRDPGFGAPNNFSLSDAIEFSVGP